MQHLGSTVSCLGPFLQREDEGGHFHEMGSPFGNNACFFWNCCPGVLSWFSGPGFFLGNTPPICSCPFLELGSATRGIGFDFYWMA